MGSTQFLRYSDMNMKNDYSLEVYLHTACTQKKLCLFCRSPCSFFDNSVLLSNLKFINSFSAKAGKPRVMNRRIRATIYIKKRNVKFWQ